MILTNSPHYLTIPWVSPSSGTTPDKYIVEVYVWDGAKASVPASATYELENINPLALTGNSDINISPYINDVLTVQLDRSANSTVFYGSSAVWVQTQVIYYIGGVAQSAEFVVTDLAIKGYGYGIEGKNTTIPTNNVLTDATVVNVSKSSQFTISFKTSESETTPFTIISYPDNLINFSETFIIATLSKELISKAFVQVSTASTEDYIELKRDGVLIQTLNIKSELRYTPFDCWFLNKYGQLQSMTFFKEKTTSLKTKSESYESSNGQPIDGVHQFVEYNKTGRTSFKAKTGFISEDNNEVIKQMLLSESAWIVEGTVFNPVNLSSSNVEYKSRQKDRLLDYEISFDYAYSEINNI